MGGRYKLFATLSLLCLFSLGALAQSGPSLVDMAKQKSSDKKARRVITDDDMPQHPSTPAPATTSAPGTASEAGGTSSVARGASNSSTGEAAPEAGSTVASVPDQPKSEKVKQLQDKLKTVQADTELLQTELKKLADKARDAESDFRRRMYQDAIEHQQATLAEFDKKRQEIEKEIASQDSSGKTEEPK